ncbi:MAG: NAD(P)-dependent oxidoreductase [Candidatus Bathyarchaeota archaeon]|nr:NAD(P)-dependent oxidoreductase [Candidatus Bathyarchaeota archaeon]
MPIKHPSFSVEAVTQGPNHYFFGYYDKSPWDPSGRYMLGLEVNFMDRPPSPDDAAMVGLIDLEENRVFNSLARTYSWNWQQGAMLQWLPSQSGRLIIYNVRRGRRLISVVRNFETGETRELPLPVYAISHDGRSALTLNFARVARTRPGYGYVGVPDLWAEEKAPEEDGIRWMNLETGEHRLVVSLGRMASFRPRLEMKNAVHWFNHLLFNPDDRRFIFLHRWRRVDDRCRWRTRLFTSDLDGADLCLLADDDMISHFDWRDSTHILAWARKKGIGDRFFVFTDRSDEFEVVGEGVLYCDGHCSYSPDRRWILIDTSSDEENKRWLLLYRPETRRLVGLGRFYSPPEVRGEIRCDLHPRWSRDGGYVCVDSVHEGHRQMYILDISSIVE